MPGYILAVPGGVAGIYDKMQMTLPKLATCNSSLWTVFYAPDENWTTVEPGRDYTCVKGRWPSKSGFYTDPAIPSALILSRDFSAMASMPWSPWHYMYGGTQSTKYIMGICKRATGEGLGGAVVQGFRTSDDLYIGETTTDDGGRYMLATPNTPTDAHYLVAYYASGNLAGTTVNTLIPTWRDGTV